MTSLGEAFAPVRAALESTGVRYAVGGSWASTAFGEPRFTNDVDILADFTPYSLDKFLRALSEACYVDTDEAMDAVRAGRPFNVIYMPLALKFDFFTASAFPLGARELERAIFLTETELSDSSTPFVTPEDILLAKLHWYREGGEISEVQWRDIRGIVRACGKNLDREYLLQSAAVLGLRAQLAKALDEV
ncbi:MAG: nucleotidyltransferase family protein [Bryobacterales bacterium]|nr:nucleotidyltransferase family protein [Bryobacterales bacterium]